MQQYMPGWFYQPQCDGPECKQNLLWVIIICTRVAGKINYLYSALNE